MTRLFVLGLSAATAALLLQLPWPPSALAGRLTPQHRRAAPPGPHLRRGGDQFKNRRHAAAPDAGAGSLDYKAYGGGVEEGEGDRGEMTAAHHRGQVGSSSGSQKGNKMSRQRKYDASYHRSASQSQSEWAGWSAGVSTGNKGGKGKAAAKGGGGGSGMKNGMGAGGGGGSFVGEAGGWQKAEKGGGKGSAKGGQRKRHHGRKKSGAARAKGGKRRGKGPGMATAKGGEMSEKKKVPQSNDDDEEWIICDNPLLWGEASAPSHCEKGNPEHVMTRFRIRLQPYQGDREEDDDTSLNAVEMHCSNGAEKHPHGGFFGTWLPWSDECPGGFNGMAVKHEGNQGGEDDTALNCVRFYCPHHQRWMEPPTCGHRGRWYNPVYCEGNRRISALTVVTQELIVGDNTVTNDIAAGCTTRPTKTAAKGKAGAAPAPDYGQDYDDATGNSTAAATAAPKRRLQHRRQGRNRYRLGNGEAAGKRRMRGNATDTSAAAGNDYYYYGE